MLSKNVTVLQNNASCTVYTAVKADIRNGLRDILSQVLPVLIKALWPFLRASWMAAAADVGGDCMGYARVPSISKNKSLDIREYLSVKSLSDCYAAIISWHFPEDKHDHSPHAKTTSVLRCLFSFHAGLYGRAKGVEKSAIFSCFSTLHHGAFFLSLI